jgi:hypothetical protein
MESIQQHIDNLLNSNLGKIKESNLYNISKRKKVYQFDLDNNIIRIFDSVTQFQKTYPQQSGRSSINRLKYNRFFNGYYYSFDKNFIIPKKIKKRGRPQSVQLIKDDIVMYEFDSVKQAQEFLQVNSSTINDAANGRQKTCRGYIVKKVLVVSK